MHRVLARNGLVKPQEQRHGRKYKRWQRDAPVRLWQLDIVGGVPLAGGREAKIVTGIDDCSRFVVVSAVIMVQSGRAVTEAFAAAMRRYGVPFEVLTDNGKQFTGRHIRPQPVEVLFERVCRENGILGSLLLDRSAAVRSAARWRWEQQHGDPGPVYRAALGSARSREIAAALHGLADGHDGSLPAAAVPFLAHPSPAVRRAAAQAAARHADADAIVRYLAPLLLDSSRKVTATALRHLRGQAVPTSVLAALDGAGTERARRTALSVRQQSGTWNRVHADLAAASSPDPGLAEAGRADLLAWLQHGAATTYAPYGMPAPAQGAQIAALLPASKLSQRQQREIAFTAGIRLPYAGSDQTP